MYAVLDNDNNAVIEIETRDIDIDLLIVPELQHLYISIKQDDDISIGDIYDYNDRLFKKIYTIATITNDYVSSIKYSFNSNVLSSNEICIRGKLDVLNSKYINNEFIKLKPLTMSEQLDLLKADNFSYLERINALEEALLVLMEGTSNV